ncbi:MAG TPA: MFS transporter, partial [Rhizomicrobium sp.]|nr:MFS transporter [Rhizomicrobium sp.]
GIPVYLSFLFGFVRDLWNPLGMRDRGYFLLFAPITAAIFLWLALTQITYVGLVAGMFLAMTSFRLVSAAYQGLLALVGQEKMMSGRLSALWQIISALPYIVGAVASGWVAENLSPEKTFILAAGLSLAMLVFAWWRPKAVFPESYNRPEAKGSTLWGDIKRLVGHRAVYPAVMINFMFSFAPGANTPLQFYLTNKLHASDAIYTDYYAIFVAAFVPMFFVYGWLCKRMPLKRLLWWGTIISVPQMIPLAMIHSPIAALWLALPIGLMGGIAAGSYYDLAIRSCPPGLQGTLMMMVDGVISLAGRGSDVLGSKIYDSSPENGFLYCVIATTIVYALILPVIWTIPKGLIATTDGEQNLEMQATMAAEIAAT